jgi:hypothetical protein
LCGLLSTPRKYLVKERKEVRKRREDARTKKKGITEMRGIAWILRLNPASADASSALPSIFGSG